MDVASSYALVFSFFVGVLLLSISGSLSRIEKSLSKLAKIAESSPGKQTQD